LPVCKVAVLRDTLLKDLNVAAAVRELVDWLSARDPTSADSLAAAGAAMAIIEWAAELGDWPAVVRLTRVAEPVLTLAGRWEASRHALDRGLEAARTTGDRAAEALFCHEQGTLALCDDQLADAGRLLRQALDIRQRQGDRRGAEVTWHNLQVLQPGPPHPPAATRPPRSRRKVAVIAGCAALLLLGIGLVRTATLLAFRHQPSVTTFSSPAATPRLSSTSPASGTSQSSPDSGSSLPPVLLALAPPELQSVAVGVQENAQISVTGGAAPYKFSITAGALPSGLSLNLASGLITGTPLAAGSYQFTITATGSPPAGGTGSKAYTLQVTPAPVTLVLAPASLPSAEVSDCPSPSSYSVTITASGGTAPYTYAVTTGSLPPGMALDPGTGVISGIPTALGTSTFTVTATDSAPTPDTGSQSYTIAVTPVAVIACPSP
jgi:Putative Ig domain